MYIALGWILRATFIPYREQRKILDQILIQDFYDNLFFLNLFRDIALGWIQCATNITHRARPKTWRFLSKRTVF